MNTYDTQSSPPKTYVPVWLWAVFGGLLLCALVCGGVIGFAWSAGTAVFEGLGGAMTSLSEDEKACAANLRKLHQGMTLYAHEWDGRLPPNDNWQVLLYRGGTPRSAFRCPSEEQPAEIDVPGEERLLWSYLYDFGGESLADLTDADLVWDAGYPHDDGSSALFVDGEGWIAKSTYQYVLDPEDTPPDSGGGRGAEDL